MSVAFSELLAPRCWEALKRYDDEKPHDDRGKPKTLWIDYEGPRAEWLAFKLKKIFERDLKLNVHAVEDMGSRFVNSTKDMPDEELSRRADEAIEKLNRTDFYMQIGDNQDEENITLTPTERTRYRELLRNPVRTKGYTHPDGWLILNPNFEHYIRCEAEKHFNLFEDIDGDMVRNKMRFNMLEPLNAPLVDYGCVDREIQRLKAIMDEACDKNETVRIEAIEPLVVGVGRTIFKKTDLRFQLHGKTQISTTKRNLPNGENYIGVKLGTMEGTILIRDTAYEGEIFPWLYLTFREGKLVVDEIASSTPERTAKAKEILSRDGASVPVEFAISYNPYVRNAMYDAIFDEKRSGGIHFALGNAITGITSNGNESSVHWDMVYAPLISAKPRHFLSRMVSPKPQNWTLTIGNRTLLEGNQFMLPELDNLNGHRLREKQQHIPEGIEYDLIDPEKKDEFIAAQRKPRPTHGVYR